MGKSNVKWGQALSWDEIAKIYDKETGGCARIKTMDNVGRWAESRKDLIYVCPQEGTFHLIQGKK